jgi:hypothetical protein
MDRIEVIAGELHVATQSQPDAFRSGEFRVLAQVVVAAAPALDVDGQIALTKLGAWICGVDDLIDRPGVRDADIAREVERYEQITAGGGAGDPVGRLFVDVIDALGARPAAAALYPVFARQIVQALDAMRLGSAKIPLAEYLRSAAESILVKPVVTAAAILFGDAVELPALLAAECHLATAIRIANDRATHGREVHEHAVNVFVACDATEDELLAIQARALGELDTAADRLPAAMADFVRAFAAQMIGVYAAQRLR